MALNNHNLFVVNEVLKESKGFISIEGDIDINPSLRFLIEEAEGIIFVCSSVFSFKFKLNKKNQIISTARGYKIGFKPTNYKKIVFFKKKGENFSISFCSAPDTQPPIPEPFEET